MGKIWLKGKGNKNGSEYDKIEKKFEGRILKTIEYIREKYNITSSIMFGKKFHYEKRGEKYVLGQYIPL